jgi:hypothetical protein
VPILVTHLERRLGQISISWSGQPQEALPRFNVGGFTGGVFADTASYATLGLSKVPLHHPDHERHFFLEFVASQHGEVKSSSDFFLLILDYMWSRCIDSRQAVLRGDVVELPSDLVINSRFTALYVALPVYFDDEFQSVAIENGQKVAIVWLVPITTGEAKFIADYGWQRFEQLLSEQDPDLMDRDRPSIA